MTDEEIEMLEKVLKTYSYILIGHREEMWESDQKFFEMIQALEKLLGRNLNTFPWS